MKSETVTLGDRPLAPGRIEVSLAVALRVGGGMTREGVECLASAGVMDREHLRQLGRQLIELADNPMVGVVVIDTGVRASIGVEAYARKAEGRS